MPPPTVLSVPAGKSYAIIEKHRIYSCPSAYVYKATPLIAFRTAPPGSKMERVFAIQRIEIADPSDIEGTCKAEPAIVQRIASYVSDAEPVGVLAKPGKYRFYVLAPEVAASLPHAPAPKEAFKGPLYFSLAELQSSTPTVAPLPALTYKEKLLDERWITKRDRIKVQRNGKCERCENTDDLDLHHGYYSPFLEPWEYRDESLWLLCRHCHNEIQHLLTSIHMVIGVTHPRDLDQLKSRIADTAFEVQFGISAVEAEEILREERCIQATLYSDYQAEITACSDLGPSIAEQLASLTAQTFSGIEIVIAQREQDPDGNAFVSGPDPATVDRIQTFLDHEREKLG